MPPAVLDSALILWTRTRSRRGASDRMLLSAVVCVECQSTELRDSPATNVQESVLFEIVNSPFWMNEMQELESKEYFDGL